MSTVTRWNNVAGCCSVELERDGLGMLVDMETDETIPGQLQLLPIKDYCEIVIHFLSSGYDDPGRTYGDPYDCYPPDSEDERTLDEIEFRYGPRDSVFIKDGPLAELVFDHWFDKVEQADVDSPNDDDRPDYDDIY